MQTKVSLRELESRLQTRWDQVWVFVPPLQQIVFARANRAIKQSECTDFKAFYDEFLMAFTLDSYTFEPVNL